MSKVILYFFCLAGAVIGQQGPFVRIPQGDVIGTYQKSFKGRVVSAFEGIPYAKPPVDQLRFEEPQPFGKWDDILVANTTYNCLSYISFPKSLTGVFGTEDCLYIYVYIPREKVNPEENLDVVVHIHGGAYMVGSPKLVAGPDFMMDQDVVYVSFNYRLGILGFLSTEDSVVPGNNGMKDQSMALKWIKDNIKYFGGNPNSITITGTSAGGSSVHYHYLSNLSRGLFNRGFSQSGTALQCWALTENPLDKAKQVAKYLDCPTDCTAEMVKCLRDTDVDDVVEAQEIFYMAFDTLPPTPFGPVIEKQSANPFISKHPYDLLSNKQVYDVPWVSSNVKDEGLVPAGLATQEVLDEINTHLDIMVYALDLQDTVDKSDQIGVLSKMREHYLKNEMVTFENIYNLVELYTDRFFAVDSEKALRLHSEAVHSPVYYYFYTYIMQMKSFFSKNVKKGVAHGDDSQLLFRSLVGIPKELEDRQVMDIMTNFLATYAQTGVPKVENVEWIAVKPKENEFNFLHIGGPKNISMMKMASIGEKAFWRSLPIKENEKLFQ